MYNQPTFQSPEILNMQNYPQTSPNYITDNSPYYTDIDGSENIILKTKNNIQTFLANLKGEESSNYYNKSIDNIHYRNSRSNSINKQIMRSYNNINYNYSNQNMNNNSIKRSRAPNLIPLNLKRGMSPVPIDPNNNNFYDNSNEYSPLSNNNIEMNEEYQERNNSKIKTKLIKNKILQDNNYNNNINKNNNN